MSGEPRKPKCCLYMNCVAGADNGNALLVLHTAYRAWSMSVLTVSGALGRVSPSPPYELAPDDTAEVGVSAKCNKYKGAMGMVLYESPHVLQTCCAHGFDEILSAVAGNMKCVHSISGATTESTQAWSHVQCTIRSGMADSHVASQPCCIATTGGLKHVFWMHATDVTMGGNGSPSPTAK